MSICKNKKNRKCKPAFPVPLPSSFLQQLRKQSQEQLSQPQSRAPAGLILLRHFPALFQCLLHIPPDIQHRITICHKTPIFKMMIKAPVIQIDRAASRHAIICHAHLRMTESRCPLIDPYTILYQIVIERSGDTVDQLLSGIPGVMIRTSTPRLAASESAMCHLIRDDQIRSHEPAISVRFVDDTDIDILSNLDSV
mgnify:CR=1 FL=1